MPAQPRLRLVGWLIDGQIYGLKQVPRELLAEPAQAVYVKIDEEVETRDGPGTPATSGQR